MFKTLFLLIYCLLTAYLYWRAHCYVKHKSAFLKILTFIAFCVLCLSLISTTAWGEKLPFELNYWAHQINHVWLFSLAYSVPLAIGFHIFSLRPNKQSRHWFFLWSVLILGTTLLLCGYHQYKEIKVVELEIPVEDWNGIDGKPLTVVFASDLHFGYTINKPRAKEMVDAIMAEKADLILFGGDIIDRSIVPLQKQRIDQDLSRLKATYGVYTIMGNHEGPGIPVREYLRSCGMNLLIDTAIQIPGVVNLIGRNDIGHDNYLRSEKLDTITPDDFRKPLKELKAMLPNKTHLPTILLDHAPKIPSVKDLSGIDIMLSGHTHNGQIFPFNLILSATHELTYGAKKKGNTLLFVTSGLGLWGARFRLGTQTEIVRIRFVPEKRNKVQILFTSDMHSQLQADRKTGLGGFARLATSLSRAKKQFSGATVVVDAGDFTMGTKYHTLFTRGLPELCLMSQMGYDAVTIGNHEFDFTATGMETALRRIHDTSALNKLICPNLNVPLLRTPKTRIISKYISPGDSLRIGIFGVLGKDAIADAPTAGITFSDPVQHAIECVAELRRQHVDLIIALSHNGLAKQNKENDLFLAEKVKGIDVIVSGHTHTLLNQAIEKPSIIVSSGSKAAYLGQLILTHKNKHWNVSDYRLIPMDTSIPEDPRIKRKIDFLEPQLNQNYFRLFGCEAKTKIGFTTHHYPDLDQMQSHFGDNPITQIITDAFVYAGQQWNCTSAGKKNIVSIYGTSIPTVGVLGMGNLRASLPTGEILAEDVFNLLSFGSGPDGLAGFPLISVYLTRNEVLTLCEMDANIGSRKRDFQLQFSGLKYASNPLRPFFNKVYRMELTTQRSQPNDKQLIRIITNLYAAQRLSDVEKMSHGLLHITPKDEYGNPINDMNSRILRTAQGSEVKEWWAVMQYIKQYTPTERETPAEIRKDTQPIGCWSSIKTLFGNYNRFGWIQCSILILVMGLLFLLTRNIVRKIKR